MPLLALLFLIAQAGLPKVPPPMPVDEEPTAFACTFASAVLGGACTYEAPRGPGDARENSRLAAQAGAAECSSMSRGDADIRKDCESAVAEVSLSSKCALRSRLADPNGNLTADAPDCVAAPQAVLQHTFF